MITIFSLDEISKEIERLGIESFSKRFIRISDRLSVETGEPIEKSAALILWAVTQLSNSESVAKREIRIAETTARKREVLHLVALGVHQKEIAKRVGVQSARTIQRDLKEKRG